jgi:VIT1/CCC1 family predicted Fe2+/Mn2+ transporter
MRLSKLRVEAMRREGEPAERDEPQRERNGSDRRSASATARQMLLIAAAALFVAFAVANFRPVRVSFLLFTTQARVVTVIVVAGALGFLAGYLSGRPSREDRRGLREHHRS